MDRPTKPPLEPPPPNVLRRYLIAHFDRGPIATDLPCNGCGYNLRGLKRGGRCPECGRAIEHDRYTEDLLETANRRWLVKIYIGSWLTLVATVLAAASIVAAAISVPLTFIIVFGAAMSAYGGGVWLMTTAEHPKEENVSWYAPRRLARYAGIVLWLWAALIIVVICIRIDVPGWLFVPGPFIAGLSISMLFGVNSVLARRMKDDRLGYNCITAMWVLGASGAASGVVAILAYGSTTIFDVVAGFVACCASVLISAPVFLATIVLQVQLTRGLHYTCKFARGRSAVD